MSLSRSSHALRGMAKRGYQALFSRYLLATNTVISVALSAGGDLLQQRYEILSGRMSCVNTKRTSHMAITGLTGGPVCHYWYIFLDKIFQGHTFKVIMKKVVVDQLFFSPFLIILFFATVGMLEKSSPRKVWKEMIHKGSEIFIIECALWPPVQVINFLFLPTRFRVLYDNVASLGFDYYYSYVKYRDYKKLKHDVDDISI